MQAIGNREITLIDSMDIGDKFFSFRTITDPRVLPLNGTFVYPKNKYPQLAKMYGQPIDLYLQLAAPATMPAGTVSGIAWSPSGAFLGCAHATTPFVTFYTFSAPTLTKMTDPGTLPASAGVSIAWSPNSRYCGIVHATTPFVTFYDFNTGSPVKLTNPATLPAGAGSSVFWSPNGRYCVVGHATTPFMTVYDFNSGAPVKITDPTGLPAGNVIGGEFSPDSSKFAVSSILFSPYLIFYSISGAGPAVKLTDPAAPMFGPSAQSPVSWSSNNIVSVGTNSTIQIFRYDMTSGTPVAMAFPNALTTSFNVSIASSDLSPDNQYLAIGYASNTNGYEADILSNIEGANPIFANPYQPPSNPRTGVHYVSWHSTGRYLAIGQTLTAPWLTVYDVAGCDTTKDFRLLYEPYGYIKALN